VSCGECCDCCYHCNYVCDGCLVFYGPRDAPQYGPHTAREHFAVLMSESIKRVYAKLDYSMFGPAPLLTRIQKVSGLLEFTEPT
jgi:hypothetical protein